MNKKNERNPRRRIWIIPLIILLVLLILLAAAFLFIKSKLNRLQYDVVDPRPAYSPAAAETVDPADVPAAENDYSVDVSGLEYVENVEAAQEAPVEENAGIFNLLLLGTDERTYEFSDSARSDCTMIVSLDLDKGAGKLISLERGMGVVMYGGKYEGQVDLLTHCFRWGGADLMLTEVQRYFQVDVERYVRVNFNAVIKIVDILGGVDVELSAEEAGMINEHFANGGYRFDSPNIQTDLHAGVNHLYGPAALRYVQSRSIDSDWKRIERQRNFLQMCLDKLKDADIRTLNTLCDEILPLIRTNLTQEEILKLMLHAPKFLGGTFEQLTIPVDRETMGYTERFSGGGAFAPDYALNAKVIHDMIYGSNEK